MGALSSVLVGVSLSQFLNHSHHATADIISNHNLNLNLAPLSNTIRLMSPTREIVYV
jgi:hypothetical protein